jgi:hypothetical protein
MGEADQLNTYKKEREKNRNNDLQHLFDDLQHQNRIQNINLNQSLQQPLLLTLRQMNQSLQ